MTDNVPRSPETHDTESLLDLSEVRLVEFLESDESALSHSLQRVIAEARNRTQNYAAFGNTP